MMIVTAQLFLMGAGLFAIGLRNTDSNNRLVNVDALIGGAGMPDAYKILKTQEDREPEKSVSRNDEETEEADIVKNTEVRVRVRGERIYIDDIYAPEDAFEERFGESYDDSKQVILTDDYADYRTYSGLLDFFDGKGISVKEEKSER